MKSELRAPTTVGALSRLLPLDNAAVLELDSLSQASQDAVSDFLKAGTAPNTVRSYQGALTYWSAWLQVRYGVALGDGPIPAAVAIQFIVDHLNRPQDDGTWTHNLPLRLIRRWSTPRSKLLWDLTLTTRSAFVWQSLANGMG